MVVSFLNGKPIGAKMNRLKGVEAITEFVTQWSEGIFVFRDKGVSQELDDGCELKRSLDKLLLDLALYKDQVNQILSQLPTRRNTILERVWNFETLWNKLSSKPLKYLDGSLVSDKDKQSIICSWPI